MYVKSARATVFFFPTTAFGGPYPTANLSAEVLLLFLLSLLDSNRIFFCEDIMWCTPKKIQFLSIILTHLCLKTITKYLMFSCRNGGTAYTYSPHRLSRLGTCRRRKLFSRFSGKIGIVLANYSSRHMKVLASNIHRDNFLVGSETMKLVRSKQQNIIW